MLSDKDLKAKIEILSASRAIIHWTCVTNPVRLVDCHAALLPAGFPTPSNATLYGFKVAKAGAAQIAQRIIHNWARPLESFDLHQLIWFLSYFPPEQQTAIINSTLDYTKGFTVSDSVPAETMTAISSHLDSIAAGLLTKDPMIPHHLRNTHQLLLSYPESRHLLSEPQVATLIGGLQYHTGIEIVKEKAATAKRSRTKLSADDL